MAFAKKFTRRITVAGETYLWYLRDNSLDFGRHHIAVRRAGVAGQLLLADPFVVAIRPRSIRAAILFGLSVGWRPAEAGAPIALGYRADNFIVLPGKSPYTHAA